MNDNKDVDGVLVIDDDESVCKLLLDTINELGYPVESASSAKAGLERLNQRSFNTILTDIKLPDIDGLELLKTIKAGWPEIPVITMTEDGCMESAISSVKAGAYDYITKPIDLAAIMVAVERGLERHRYEIQTRQLVNKNRQLESLVVRDSLTGLYNHKHLQEMLRAEFGRARRYHEQLSCVMVDIDHFKSVNDVHGHQFGDYVLVSMAKVFHSMTRDVDIVARYGGEEFFIILPKTSLEGACALGEKICKAVHSHDFRHNDHTAVITVSVGVSSISEAEVNSKDDLIKHADKALYSAKRQGRNRVNCWNDTEISVSEGTHDGVDRVTDFQKKFSQFAEDTKYSFLEVVKDFVRLVDARDDHTMNHSTNVAKYAVALAKELGVSEEGVKVIENAALLHDIGKVIIPQNTLLKKDRLTETEQSILKKHSTIGVSILSKAPFFEKEMPLALHHHEWYDGSGYPYGLKGSGIPLGARILSVADAYEAMTADRSFRGKYSKEHAIKELEKCSGKQFDPEITETFMKMIENELLII